jgi:hypothetical protein
MGIKGESNLAKLSSDKPDYDISGQLGRGKQLIYLNRSSYHSPKVVEPT